MSESRTIVSPVELWTKDQGSRPRLELPDCNWDWQWEIRDRVVIQRDVKRGRSGWTARVRTEDPLYLGRPSRFFLILSDSQLGICPSSWCQEKVVKILFLFLLGLRVGDVWVVPHVGILLKRSGRLLLDRSTLSLRGKINWAGWERWSNQWHVRVGGSRGRRYTCVSFTIPGMFTGSIEGWG